MIKEIIIAVASVLIIAVLRLAFRNDKKFDGIALLTGGIAILATISILSYNLGIYRCVDCAKSAKPEKLIVSLNSLIAISSERALLILSVLFAIYIILKITQIIIDKIERNKE